MNTSDQLARKAAERLTPWIERLLTTDPQTYIAMGKIIADTYAEAIAALEAENARLRRQVEFVKRENAADTSDDGTGCCMLCFCDHNEQQPHNPDCPHAGGGE